MNKKRGKDDMDLSWSSKSDVAVFRGGKKFSLLRVLIYTSRKPARCAKTS
jgi:hypothetical protein